MVKAARLEQNIYYFLKEHPEIKLVMSPFGEVTNVVFPETCSSSTFVIIHGKVECLQYATCDSLFTYDASKDSNYYENLAKLMAE